MTQRVRGNLLDENDTLYVCLNTISGKFLLYWLSKNLFSEKNNKF